MTLPNGMSKGCGVVEYTSEEDAQRAIRDLNEKTLLGRQIFVREDREEEARYGSAAVSAHSNNFAAGRGGYGGGGHRSGAFGAFGSGHSTGRPPSKQLYVGGLNDQVGWQDLKDLFRQAGDIIRADIHTESDGTPKGSGSVAFTSAADAQAAIQMFDGAELNGMKLEVREERFSLPSSGPFGRPQAGRGGRDMGHVYGDYAGNEDGGYYGGGRHGTSSFANAAPSTQIFVKNLPWSTCNEDLVELFQTTGTVENAEVLFDNGRSKGCGVVQFTSIEEAETAISKFQNYAYGGRNLSIEFNARFRDFTAQPVGGDASGDYRM